MKNPVLVLLGVAVGAVLALLLAPESGEKLRGQISHDVTTERHKLDAQLNETVKALQKRVEAMHADLTAYIQSEEKKRNA